MQAWIPVVSGSLYFWKSVFSFRADSVLKSDGDFKSNWKFPDCVHFFGAWAETSRIETIAVVTNARKELRRCVRRLGTIIQSIFCAQSGAGIPLNFWKWSGESRYPGALSPVLENFRPAFSPDLTLRGCWRAWVFFHLIFPCAFICFLASGYPGQTLTLVFDLLLDWYFLHSNHNQANKNKDKWMRWNGRSGGRFELCALSKKISLPASFLNKKWRRLKLVVFFFQKCFVKTFSFACFNLAFCSSV